MFYWCFRHVFGIGSKCIFVHLYTCTFYVVDNSLTQFCGRRVGRGPLNWRPALSTPHGTLDKTDVEPTAQYRKSLLSRKSFAQSRRQRAWNQIMCEGRLKGPTPLSADPTGVNRLWESCRKARPSPPHFWDSYVLKSRGGVPWPLGWPLGPLGRPLEPLPLGRPLEPFGPWASPLRPLALCILVYTKAVYDIGTKILFLQSNGRNSTHKAP